jgi:hypothetical protein
MAESRRDEAHALTAEWHALHEKLYAKTAPRRFYANPSHPGAAPSIRPFDQAVADQLQAVGAKIVALAKTCGLETKPIEHILHRPIVASDQDWRAADAVIAMLLAATVPGVGKTSAATKNQNARSDLLAVAQTMRELARSPHLLRPLDIEQVAAQLIDQAIAVGGFAGSKWLGFRTCWRQNPHILNAPDIIDKFGPQEIQVPLFPPGQKTLASIVFMADTIASFASSTGARGAPKRSKPGPRRKQAPKAQAAKARRRAPSKPLTDLQRLVLEIIKVRSIEKPIHGPEIVSILQSQHRKITSTNTLATHVIPALKPYGVQSARKRGYWYETLIARRA